MSTGAFFGKGSNSPSLICKDLGVTVTQAEGGVAANDGTTAYNDYIMYTDEVVTSRFQPLNPQNSDNFVAVFYNGGQWFVDRSSNAQPNEAFTPVSTDVLITQIEAGVHTPFPSDTTIQGIKAVAANGGYTILNNTFGNGANAGELTVVGTGALGKFYARLQIDGTYLDDSGATLTLKEAMDQGYQQCDPPALVKDECYEAPTTSGFTFNSSPLIANNGNMLQSSGAVAPTSAPLRISNSGSTPIQVNEIRVRAGANGFTGSGAMTLLGVAYAETSVENISGIYRTLVFTPTGSPLVLNAGQSVNSNGNWGAMTGGFQGPVSSGAGTNPPFGAGAQSRAEITYVVGVPSTEIKKIRTYADGSLYEVDDFNCTVTEITEIPSNYSKIEELKSISEGLNVSIDSSDPSRQVISSKPSVYEIYNNSQTTVDTSSFAIQELNTERFSESFASVSGNRVTLLPGRYLVTYHWSGDIQTGPDSRSEAEHAIFVDGVQYPGTLSKTYHRENPVGAGAGSNSAIVESTNDLIVDLRSRRSSGASLIRQVIEGTKLIIQRIS